MHISEKTTVNRALIRKLREYFRISQADLAKMSGISQSTVYKIESGALESPNLATLNAISSTFHVVATQLLIENGPFPSNYDLANRLIKEENEAKS